MKWTKRLLPMLLAAVLAFGTIPAHAAELTRGEAAQRLLAAAEDYNPGVQQSDILKGYEDGELHLDDAVTRAQALVMLNRAFGGLPAPVGENARMALPADSLTDIPAWAAEELAPVLASGIADGNAVDTLTDAELETLLDRIYALEGTNLKDDYYAAVNKSWLDSSTIPAGLSVNGALYGLILTVNDQVAALIQNIDDSPQTPGTAEAKIKALYDCVLDEAGRKAAGVAPIQSYLDAIEQAKTLKELIDADRMMQQELGISTLLGFGLTADYADSNRKIAAISAVGTFLDKNFYMQGTQAQRDAYDAYLTALFTLSGMSDEAAVTATQQVYEMEKVIAAASMDPQEYNDVDKIYNLRSMEQLQTLFPNVDLTKIRETCGIQLSGEILVTDPGALEAAAGFFDDAHLDTLKAEARLMLLLSVGTTLDPAFQEASFDFSAAYYGTDQRQSAEQIAALQVQDLLADYLGRAYAEAYFSPEAKADVEEMIDEFIAIYRERIQAQDWMSAETKAKALKKLDAMNVKVGYPDSWETYLDNAEIRSPAEGGSFFSNTIAVQKAAKEQALAHQNDSVDKTEWVMQPYVVNAFYNYTANDITFPAGILQAPLYDINASREENLGGMGYIIAHEITHAFDNNGAKFDENGNVADWWTPEDYAAFQQKCDAVKAWYDGQESAPGLTCDGTLTLTENVADLGAMRCVVDAAKKLDQPDFDQLFRAVANSWCSATTRQMREYLAVTDVHAPDKQRCNRVLQTIPEFYETYDIQPGDGMWTDPASRVSVW